MAISTTLPSYLEIPPHRVERTKVKAADVLIDPEVQRDFKQPYADKIALFWVDGLDNPLHLSRRADGRDYCLDGQHTLAAGVKVGKNVFDCIRHHGLTTQQEAALHIRLQSQRKSDNALDIWKLKLAAGSVEHLQAEEYLIQHGLAVGSQIRAAGAVDWVVETYGAETFSDVLIAIERAWPSMGPGPREKWENSIIRSFGYLFGTWPSVAVASQVGAKLGKTYTAGSFVAEIKTRAKGTGGTGSRTKVGATIIAETWNRRRTRGTYPLMVPTLNDVVGDEDIDEDDDSL